MMYFYQRQKAVMVKFEWLLCAKSNQSKKKISRSTQHRERSMANATAFYVTPSTRLFISNQSLLLETKAYFNFPLDFGFGKNYMENLILDEVREIIDWLKEEEVAGRVVSISRKLSVAVLNSLWTICSGTKYSQNDPTLTNILDNFIQ